jgi:hypothetical protein
MSLESLQGALARIFTDPVLRAAYFADPAATAARLGLQGQDAATFMALDAAAVRTFAAMLQQKRTARVRRKPPLWVRIAARTRLHSLFVAGGKRAT